MAPRKATFPYLLTEASRYYEGPLEFAPFADFLPAIGELVISFSMLEARMRWCKESLLGTSLEEAYELEGFVQNFSARCKFLEVAGRPLSRETGTEMIFDQMIRDIFASNSFRNRLLHNKFCGISLLANFQSPDNLQIEKEKFLAKPEKRSYSISMREMKHSATRNLQICRDIQSWTLSVRPNAQNRVP